MIQPLTLTLFSVVVVFAQILDNAQITIDVLDSKQQKWRLLSPKTVNVTAIF